MPATAIFTSASCSIRTTQERWRRRSASTSGWSIARCLSTVPGRKNCMDDSIDALINVQAIAAEAFAALDTPFKWQSLVIALLEKEFQIPLPFYLYQRGSSQGCRNHGLLVLWLRAYGCWDLSTLDRWLRSQCNHDRLTPAR